MQWVHRSASVFRRHSFLDSFDAVTMQPATDSAMSKGRDPADLPRRSPQSIPWPKKLAFTCLVTCAFFLGLEALLALLGFDPAARTDDLLVGFSRQAPLLQTVKNQAGEKMLQTAPNKLVWFNHQSFPLNKPVNTRRVFCVGGSTTYGRPFADTSSYSGWLRELLPLVDPATHWEVINAGGVSYASYRVAAVMEELAQYQPDLFIVYSAHNEFLERRTYNKVFEASPLMRELEAGLQRTRTGSLMQRLFAHSSRVPSRRVPSSGVPTSASDTLLAEVDEMLNHSVGPLDYHADDQWHQEVLRDYELNLQRMVSIAQDADAAIVFLTPVSNLRDCSPFKSELSAEVSDAGARQLHEFVEQASQGLADERYEDSIESCRAALKIDHRYAQVHYQLGRALFGLGRYDQAERALRRSVDEDVCPLRATSDISATIRRVAAARQVPLIDVQAKTHEKCVRELGHGCLGGEYFLDHVHPNLEMHGQIALWILTELQNHLLVGGNQPSDAQVEQVRHGIDQQIDLNAHGVALRNLAKVLHWSGKFAEAAPRARDALALMPDDLESRFVLADCLFNLNQVDDAFEQYELLLSIGDFPRAYLPYGELLARRGRFIEAKELLMKAVVACRDANRARAYYALGSVHCQLREFDFGIQALEEASRLYPGDPSTMNLLAEANTAAGNPSRGRAIYQQVIDLDPNNYTAHFRLGMILLAERRHDEARRCFETAIGIDSQDARAIQALETIKQLAGQRHF